MEKDKSPAPLVLALSGGGFRATLFHLGVIRRLYELQQLHSTSYVYSVSGGSILAAHLAIHWQKYTGDEQAFSDATSQLFDFVRSDLRGRIFRRFLYIGVFVRSITRVLLPYGSPFEGLFRNSSRTLLLEEYYRQLYGDCDIRILSPNGATSSPHFCVLATSLTTGMQCFFDRTGFHWVDEKGEVCQVPTDNVAVATAVTASSAFPLFFPARPFSYDDLKCDINKFPTLQHLTDGGVFDNLGISLASKCPTFKTTPECQFVISDAQGHFDWLISENIGEIERSMRANDILMKRISELEMSKLPRPPAVCAISKEVSSKDYLKVAEQGMLKKIRTDLDTFSEPEIAALVRHGYEVACTSLPGCDTAPRRFESWIAVPKIVSDLDYGEELLKSQSLRVFSQRHVMVCLLSLLVCAIVMSVVLAMVILIVQKYGRAQVVERMSYRNEAMVGTFPCTMVPANNGPLKGGQIIVPSSHVDVLAAAPTYVWCCECATEPVSENEWNRDTAVRLGLFHCYRVDKKSERLVATYIGKQSGGRVMPNNMRGPVTVLTFYDDAGTETLVKAWPVECEGGPNKGYTHLLLGFPPACVNDGIVYHFVFCIANTEKFRPNPIEMSPLGVIALYRLETMVFPGEEQASGSKLVYVGDVLGLPRLQGSQK